MENQSPLALRQKTYWQCEKMVWSRGRKKFFADIGVLPTVLTVVASVITALIIQTTRAQAGDVLGDAVVALIVFVLLCFAVMIWYVSRESVILYNEKQITLRKYLDKYESPNPPCPLIITPYQEQPSHSKIGIKIENPPTNQKISDLRVNLEELAVCSPNGEKIPKQIDNADRGFPHGSSIVNGTIGPDQFGILFMASVMLNFITFDLRQPYEFNDMKHVSDQSLTGPMIADYEMKFSVSGYVGERLFKKSTYLAHVHVDSQYNGTWHTTAEMTSVEKLTSEEESGKKANGTQS